MKATLDLKTKDCVNGLCLHKDQKNYHILKNKPKVFTFNLVWSHGDDSDFMQRLTRISIFNFLLLIPNTFDPFTIFKKKQD